MPGPPPKDPAIRARRNKVAGAAALEDNRQHARVPPLPRRRGADGAKLPKGDAADWHPNVRAWWRAVWRSPMASRFTAADTHELYLLAELRDVFHKGDRTKAAEIRLQRACFGLTPLDRWRLQWEVVADAIPVKPRAVAPPSAPPTSPGEDPRAILRAVK